MNTSHVSTDALDSTEYPLIEPLRGSFHVANVTEQERYANFDGVMHP